MPDFADDVQWSIPSKFRVSLDISDEAAHALLLQCDAEQKKLGAKINAPFARNTPQERARSKAYITIQTILAVKGARRKFSGEQREQLAEAFAAIGRYDLAYETTRKHKKLYRSYWEAVFLADEETCEHPDKHKYVKERVFSIKHGKEKSLVVCNVCSFANVQDTPEILKQNFRQERQIQGATRGMSISAAREWHNQYLRTQR